MEKFFWDVLGVVLLLANVISFVIFLVTDGAVWGFATFSLLVANFIYAKKYPTWLEV